MEKKLSQRGLANLCDISNTYLSDIETGRTNPSLKTLQKLGESLEVNIRDFFDKSEEGNLYLVNHSKTLE